jgi:hypothetical protein
VQWLRVDPLQLHLFERPGGAPTSSRGPYCGRFRDRLPDGSGARRPRPHDVRTSPLRAVERQRADVSARPAGNLIEIDWPAVNTLDPTIRAEVRELADGHPQNEEKCRYPFLDRQDAGGGPRDGSSAWHGSCLYHGRASLPPTTPVPALVHRRRSRSGRAQPSPTQASHQGSASGRTRVRNPTAPG